jgi:hypothetical protein
MIGRALAGLPLVFVLAMSTMGCRGKLVGTAELLGPGTTEASFEASGKQLTLWADTDGKWRGGENSKMDVSYEIDVVRGGANLAHLSCSTASSGTQVCGTSTTINSAHDADCEIALACKLPDLAAGTFQLKVTGRTGPNVTLVRKMSLNVRSK